ncbi:MAG: NAD(P)-dependent dehydrogenase (short-subunit alcohol dehydrogenase family) [Actinomycetes bacterium]|jgi:NAD(P)-dependent dehydrogenase (short-subunit alcohol dehydrogenase family)
MRPVQLDVTVEADVQGVANEVAELRQLGNRIAGVFSNAGIAQYVGDLSSEGCPMETQERVMAVDHFGAVRFIRAMLPYLRPDRGRVVINSALMTHTVLPFNAGYAAAKCALEGWADSLRIEVGPLGVKVVILQPAAISSAMEGKMNTSQIPDDGPYPGQRAMAEFFLGIQAHMANSPKTDPQLVADLVAHALQAKRPRSRYIAGGGSKAVYLLGLFPDHVQDFVKNQGLARVQSRSLEATTRTVR